MPRRTTNVPLKHVHGFIDLMAVKVQALVDAATRQGELEAAAAEAAAELDRVVRSDDEKERQWAETVAKQRTEVSE